MNQGEGTVVPADISRDVDVARGLAALGVVWGHSVYGIDLPVELNGAFWVWVFLPVSGYLVARGFMGGYSNARFGPRRFLWNRAVRIIPLSWLALLIGVVMVAIADEVPSDAWRQFLFMPERNSMSLVGPLWTVAAELQFYLFAALVLPILLSIRRHWRVIGAVAFLGVTCVVARLWMDADYDNAAQPRGLIANLPFFAAGVLFASTDRPVVRAPASVKAALVTGCVAVAWYYQNFDASYFWRWGSFTGGVYGGGALCAVLLSAVVLWIGRSTGGGGWFRLPVLGGLVEALRWCGRRTYGIYVYHAVLLHVNLYFLKLANGWPKLALLLLAIPIAAVSFSTIERWFGALKLPAPGRAGPPQRIHDVPESAL